MGKTATLDPLDRRLLRALRDNARASFVELAELLETSEGTVRARLKRLVDEGLIRRFTIRTAGANLRACIEIEASTNVNTSLLTETISSWDEVEVVYEVSGDRDILVIAEAHDTDQLNDLIERIRQLPDVRATHTRLILKEV